MGLLWWAFAIYHCLWFLLDNHDDIVIESILCGQLCVANSL